MDESSCQRTISKSDPAILNYYRQFLMKGFDCQNISKSFFSTRNHYFIIIFKVDKTFDYGGLEQAIFEAVSSNGIDIKSQLLRSMIEFEIPEKEFSAASVRFLNLK